MILQVAGPAGTGITMFLPFAAPPYTEVFLSFPAWIVYPENFRYPAPGTYGCRLFSYILFNRRALIRCFYFLLFHKNEIKVNT